MKKLSGLFKFGIRKKLVAGFLAVSLVLVGAVSATLVEVNKIQKVTNRIVELRMPTAAASTSIVNNINASLAALRGFMLTGNATFKKQREVIWLDIEKTVAIMDELSKNWTVPANIEKWAEFKSVLAEFSIAQTQVEGVAHTIDEQPATKILVQNAAPLAGNIIGNITEMIDLESELPVTAERKNLFLQMANFRGSFGLGLANIRAYLLTGDAKFSKIFGEFWSRNEKAYSNLSGMKALLSPAQMTAFDQIIVNREKFMPLPTRMFQIRGSSEWNTAQLLLIREAAPRAGKLLTILSGALDADGSRAGGMVDNQKGLMVKDGTLVNQEASFLITFEWILLAIGIILSGIIAFFTSRSIVNPVRNIIFVMAELTGGNNDVEVIGLDRSDETGEMARAVQVFKENAIENIRLQKEEELAREEQTKREQDERDREATDNAERAARQERVDGLTSGFGDTVEEILGVVSAQSTEMEATAQSMSEIAKQTMDESVSVSSAAEQASASVQTVASAAEELSSSISEISRQVTHSSEISTEAVGAANETNATIRELAEAAQRVGDVVDLINDIAEQTNLLALNATIEAARAGDAGKGFAVVASEVKNLATQTAKATDDIGSQISEIQSSTGKAVSAIEGISTTITQMNEIATAIAAAVEEQGAATNEISRNVQEAASGTQSVSESIVNVRAASEQTGTASGDVLSSSQELAERFNTLNNEVAEFLANIKVA